MPDLKVIKTREDAWEACLALWKRLSELPSGAVVHGDLKGGIITELGYAHMENDCPMCAYDQVKGGDCDYCPLEIHAGGCEKMAFQKWDMKQLHDQNAAKAFYKELLKIARMDGYLPRRGKQ